jgi:hypothetical protein
VAGILAGQGGSEQKDERTCVGENLIPLLVCTAIIHQVTSGRSEMTAVLINSPE